MHTRTADSASDLSEERVVDSERLVAGDHRRSAALNVDPGRLLPVERRHVAVVAAVQTPRRARVGALRPRLLRCAAQYTIGVVILGIGRASSRRHKPP